jgi:hypothetical protein
VRRIHNQRSIDSVIPGRALSGRPILPAWQEARTAEGDKVEHLQVDVAHLIDVRPNRIGVMDGKEIHADMENLVIARPKPFAERRRVGLDRFDE